MIRSSPESESVRVEGIESTPQAQMIDQQVKVLFVTFDSPKLGQVRLAVRTVEQLCSANSND